MLKKAVYPALMLLIIWSFSLTAEPGVLTDIIPVAETANETSNDPVPESTRVEEPQLLIHFSLDGIVCDIQKPANPDKNPAFIITATFPYEINLENLVAEFETEENVQVFVNDVRQISGIMPNDFSVPVTYLLKQDSGIEQEYRVKTIFGPEFRMDLGGNIHPSYNTTYGMVNIGYDGDLFIGGKFNHFLIGGEVTDSYFVFNGQSGGINISGYWNILRGAFINSFLLTRDWGMKWGIGGSWIYSKFDFNSITRYIRNNPGFFAQFDVYFSPWKFTQIDIINQFDLFMNIANGNPFASIENFYPYYKGGVQFVFLDFIEWLRIHFGVSWLYSYYQKDGINTTIGMVVFDTGLHLDLQFPSLLKAQITNKSRKIEEKTAGSGSTTLKDAKRNDIIEFPGILFKAGPNGEDTNELAEESKAALSEIAAVLSSKKNMEISIKIYSKKSDDPVSLLSKSIEKLKVIKMHLINLGIEENRIRIPSEVSILDENYTTNPILVRIVVLKE